MSEQDNLQLRSFKSFINLIMRPGGSVFFEVQKLETITSGNPHTKHEILNAFIAGIPAMLTALDAALEEANKKEVARALHKLKSSVSWICIDPLFHFFQRMESTAWLAGTAEYRNDINVLMAATRMLAEEAATHLGSVSEKPPNTVSEKS